MNYLFHGNEVLYWNNNVKLINVKLKTNVKLHLPLNTNSKSVFKFSGEGLEMYMLE